VDKNRRSNPARIEADMPGGIILSKQPFFLLYTIVHLMETFGGKFDFERFFFVVWLFFAFGVKTSKSSSLVRTRHIRPLGLLF